MRHYSPLPYTAYVLPGCEFQYAKGPEVWNFLWLSMLALDVLADRSRRNGELLDSIDSEFAGVASATWTISLNPKFVWPGTPTPIMGASAIDFVEQVKDCRDLILPSNWEVLGGQTWLDTMTQRAYEADGMADIFKAASESANVVIANFRQKKVVG